MTKNIFLLIFYYILTNIITLATLALLVKIEDQPIDMYRNCFHTHWGETILMQSVWENICCEKLSQKAYENTHMWETEPM